MRLLAVDPGAHSGVAYLVDGTPTFAAVFRMEDTAEKLGCLIADTKPDTLLCEGWERRGNRLNAASTYPNRVLGMCEALSRERGVLMVEAGASLWMRQFCKNAELLPDLPIVYSESQRVAKAICVHLGGYPEHLFADIPPKLRRHAIDAVGLALWGSLSMKGK